MNAKDVLKIALSNSMSIVKMYLADLSDEDLLVRAVPNANHIAWQLGHLIKSEANIPNQVPDAVLAELPAGFAARYTKETAKNDSADAFNNKNDFISLYDRVRVCSLTTLDKLSEADLDTKTTGPIAPLAPNFGALFNLMAAHAMMHAGQFSVVRRKLGKPVLF